MNHPPPSALPLHRFSPPSKIYSDSRRMVSGYHATQKNRLFNIKSSDVTFNGVVFASGSVNTNGGCVHVDGGSTVEFQDSEFIACTAYGQGGAIYTEESTATVSGGIFTSCSAAYVGLNGDWGCAADQCAQTLYLSDKPVLCLVSHPRPPPPLPSSRSYRRRRRRRRRRRFPPSILHTPLHPGMVAEFIWTYPRRGPCPARPTLQP